VTADLILHVVDASAPEEELEGMQRAVDEVLEEIGAGARPRVLVLNKGDLLTDDERRLLELRHPGSLVVSAANGEGVDLLKDRIAAEFRDRLETIELLVPFERGRVLSELHELAGDLEREDTPEGVLVRARVPAGVAARLRPYEQNGRRPG
jgi:GTP-binding protein HflX